MAQFSKKYYLFLILFLGMLSAFGPFVTDMYLPTLPSMAEIFHTTASLVQFGLATSMLGLAVGQIFFGPLSDKYGRKAVLISAMILFAVSTVGAIYSPTIEFFNFCRFLQGLGGSGGIVSPIVGLGNILHTTLLLLCLCSLASLLFALHAYRRPIPPLA